MAVRRLRQERPQNIVALFTQAVSHMCATVEAPSPEATPQTLVCLRVLTRMMPFLLVSGASQVL